ncbi:MAG: 4Fe-4S dicluster domain-containing protein [Dehalococcoidales bacterium]|nr:4Fe-4S dicluster domain-containing protein [Dehalococcoidales bacterium]
MPQLGFYIDQSRCTGCYTCTVSCKDWHDIPAGPVHWRRVTAIEKGEFPRVFVAFLSLSCLHCAEPACVAACPVNAISKRAEDGIVIVNRDACLGNDDCGLCKEACPYGAPQFAAEANARMQKCDFCLERWGEGKKPICVESCPMRALDAGLLTEMEAKYGKVRSVEGFTYDTANKPSVVFKARTDELLKTPAPK